MRPDGPRLTECCSGRAPSLAALGLVPAAEHWYGSRTRARLSQRARHLDGAVAQRVGEDSRMTSNTKLRITLLLGMGGLLLLGSGVQEFIEYRRREGESRTTGIESILVGALLLAVLVFLLAR